MAHSVSNALTLTANTMTQLLYNVLFFFLGTAIGYLFGYWVQTRKLRRQMTATLQTVAYIKDELTRIEEAYKLLRKQ